jgi:hypothetical protein
MKPVGKKINDSFKKFIKSFVSIFASREFAFVYCLIGTFGQITHCYFLLYSVSSFTGWFRSLQAILLSVFISSSLLYFVSIADKDDEEHEYKCIIRAINMFMVIEIAINLYYYAQNLLIQSTQLRVFDFIFAIVISGLLPITIKLYANSIKAKEWLKEFDEPIETPKGLVVDDDYNKALKQTIESTARDISNEIFKKHKTDLLMEIHKMKNDENSSYNFDRDGLNKYIEEQIAQKIKEIPETDIDDEKIKQIKDSIMEAVDQKIKENMNMFLKQFDNKVDYRIRQYGIKAKNEQFNDNK